MISAFFVLALLLCKTCTLDGFCFVARSISISERFTDGKELLLCGMG